MITNRLIHDWLELVTGYDEQHVIMANQNGPRPSESFVTWQIVSMLSMDFSDIDPENSAVPSSYDVIYTDTRRYSIGVDVNVYGPDGLIVMANLTQSTADPDTHDIFQDSGTTLLGASTIQDLTGIGDTVFNARYQSEFEFSSFSEYIKTKTNYRWDDYSITGIVGGDTVTIEP